MDIDFDDDHKMLQEQLHAFAMNVVATAPRPGSNTPNFP